MIILVTGDLTADEIIAVIRQNYNSGEICDVIWDLTNGTMKSMTDAGINEIAKASMEAVSNGSRPNGSTYFVTSNSTEYALLCKYIVYANLLGSPASYKLFKTLEEAKYVLKRHNDQNYLPKPSELVP